MRHRSSVAAPLETRGDQHLHEALNAHSGTYTKVGGFVASARSQYQTLQIVDTPQFGRVLRLDGYTMTSEFDEFHYHENLVHVAAVSHTEPARVLIVGGGDGGAAREVLRHRCVARVDVVELDAMVVKFAKTYLPTVHGDAFSNPRLKLHIGDGKHWLENTSTTYDLIILDLTDPMGHAHALYTVEFYRTCRSRLNPGGILALHVESPIARPNTCHRIVKTLEAAFPRVRPYLVFVPTYGTVLAMATASLDVDPARLPADEVESRLASRGISGLQYYNGAMHCAAFALPNYLRERLAGEAEIVSEHGNRLDGNDELPLET